MSQTMIDLLAALQDAAEQAPDAMLTLAHRSDESKWMQILSDKINLSYPFDSPPDAQFGALSLPNAAKLHAGFWQANTFADFETAELNRMELAEFLEAYLSRVFKSEDLSDYQTSFDLAERGRIEAESKQEFLRELVKLKQRFMGN